MAKLDLTLIEGYAEMSAEDKVKALEALEIADPDYSGYVKKDVFDKTSSDLASLKKQLKEKMTEDELAKQRDEESRKELEEKYNKLLHESEVSKFKANFLGMGYDEKLAEETAEAMANGDNTVVFANQKKHLDAMEKKIKADVLKDTPKPDGDGDAKTMTLAKLRALSPADRLNFAQSNPEEYEALYNGGNE